MTYYPTVTVGAVPKPKIFFSSSLRKACAGQLERHGTLNPGGRLESELRASWVSMGLQPRVL